MTTTITPQPAWSRAALAVALITAWPLAAQATNGYFQHGIGLQAQGVAGVGVALPQDGLAGANNPASTLALDNRVDLGLTWFRPTRSADIVGNGVAPNDHFDGNAKRNFFIPELGYTRRLSPTLGLGLAVFGNGGMNTDYARNPYARFGATGSAGVNLEQLFITPSVAWQLDPQHSLGAALNVVVQRFEAKGLGPFTGLSVAPGNVTDQGVDSATGLGLRLGWLGKLPAGVSVGASWSSKVHTSRFDKYRGLFADGGGFDVPSNVALGLAWQASPALTLAGDVQRIAYSQVKSVGNPLAKLFAGNALGSADGGGFGWRDITVVKVGAVYQWDAQRSLRAGFSHSGQPVPADQTFFNILAPGVVQNHLSIGGSWRVDGGEWSAAYTQALGKTVKGAGSIPNSFGGGNANVSLKEQVLGIAYSWRL